KKAGGHPLRAGWREAKAGEGGPASQLIGRPEVSKGRLLLSGSVLGAEMLPESAPPRGGGERIERTARFPPAAPPGNAAAPVPAEGAQTQEIDPKGTPAVRIFKPGKTMIYGYQALNAQASPGQPPQLEVQTRLFRDGQAIYSG